MNKHQFGLAKLLLENRMTADSKASSQSEEGTALLQAVWVGDIAGIEFLLDEGANVDLCNRRFDKLTTALGYAAELKRAKMAIVLLARGADATANIEGTPIREWAARHASGEDIFSRSMGPLVPRFSIEDLVGAAIRGRHALRAYISRRPRGVTTHELEEALQHSIRRDYLDAATALLQHGVSPDGLTLLVPPLLSALSSRGMAEFVQLLLRHGADIGRPNLLGQLPANGTSHVLEAALAFGIDLEHRMKALVKAARCGNLDSAAILLEHGVDVETPGLEETPLQAACRSSTSDEMVLFLIGKGANVNAPARPGGGRTALQAALSSQNRPVEFARLLLDHGADHSAPPAMFGGKTALEALCSNSSIDRSEFFEDFFLELLDAGAMVNRPDGEPSSVIHIVIEKRWHKVLRRFLEPQHGAIFHCTSRTDYLGPYVCLMPLRPMDYTHVIWRESWRWWQDESLRPYTPTQLAVFLRDLEALELLLDHGADANEPANYRGGRTVLQAAALMMPGPQKTEIIRALLDRGANVNADPAAVGGVTALQAAAMAGDLILAELLISHDADVNALPPLDGGRTAIEWAAEYGRLDMVQLLLNAGATGEDGWGPGFCRAISLARWNNHFAVARLLENREEVAEVHT
jgi:ankyrin repeat protein